MLDSCIHYHISFYCPYINQSGKEKAQSFNCHAFTKAELMQRMGHGSKVLFEPPSDFAFTNPVDFTQLSLFLFPAVSTKGIRASVFIDYNKPQVNLKKKSKAHCMVFHKKRESRLH